MEKGPQEGEVVLLKLKLTNWHAGEEQVELAQYVSRRWPGVRVLQMPGNIGYFVVDGDVLPSRDEDIEIVDWIGFSRR